MSSNERCGSKTRRGVAASSNEEVSMNRWTARLWTAALGGAIALVMAGCAGEGDRQLGYSYSPALNYTPQSYPFVAPIYGNNFEIGAPAWDSLVTWH
jgi:hypothetical protein